MSLLSQAPNISLFSPPEAGGRSQFKAPFFIITLNFAYGRRQSEERRGPVGEEELEGQPRGVQLQVQQQRRGGVQGVGGLAGHDRARTDFGRNSNSYEEEKVFRLLINPIIKWNND